MIITTLIDDKKLENSNLINEHGLSLHIQKEKQNILFDTGASGYFAENAKELGIDLNEVDTVIISHGHYDHGGGLETFFKENKHAPVYTKKIGNYYRVYDNGTKKNITWDKTVLEKNSQQIRYLTQDLEILENVHLLSSIKKIYPQPPDNKFLYQEKNRQLIRDDFLHELLMVIEEKDGITIFSGCSHQGILNMIETARNKFRGKPIKAVLGGFHIIESAFNNREECIFEVKEIADKILKYPLGKVYTGHCTEIKPYLLLKEVMGSKLEYLSTGMVIKL